MAPRERRGAVGPRPLDFARGALSIVEGRERPPTRLGASARSAVASAKAEACAGVRGTKSPGERRSPPVRQR
jgi:hypothetical protein